MKDACAECNRIKLGPLDNYICFLYDDQMHKAATADEQRTFVYDYRLLTRWLLKTSYNACRAAKEYPHSLQDHKQYVRYMLTGDELPPVDAVSFYVMLVSPMPAHTIMAMSFRVGNGFVPLYQPRVLPHHVLREISDEELGRGWVVYHIRLVSVRSYYFMIAFLPKNLDDRRLVRQRLKACSPNAELLDPDRTSIILNASGENEADTFMDEYRRNRSIYRELL